MIIMLDNHGMEGMLSLQQLLGSSVINPTKTYEKTPHEGHHMDPAWNFHGSIRSPG